MSTSGLRMAAVSCTDGAAYWIETTSAGSLTCYAAGMSSASPSVGPPCPEPWARSARVAALAGAAHQRLHVAPRALQGAVLCVIGRDTRGAQVSDAQRITHLPATPFACLSVFQDADAGLIEEGPEGPRWRPFGARVVLSGSQSSPLASWSPHAGRSALVLFPVEAARQLFGLDLASVHDLFVPAAEVLDASWRLLLADLQSAGDDIAVLAALERHLAPRWQALRTQAALPASLRQVGGHWMERLALQARQWGRARSTRQVERRIKALSGRSMREWQSLLKAEGVFFTARDRYQAGLPLDWAELALDEGFADQSHLVRAVKRITGFTPTVFAQRYVDDESFWLYRLWV
jgi:AraC-like DNA-binding protein